MDADCQGIAARMVKQEHVGYCCAVTFLKTQHFYIWVGDKIFSGFPLATTTAYLEFIHLFHPGWSLRCALHHADQFCRVSIPDRYH